MDERNSKRDLVLAPSEYAYMQDVTKGIVKTYTGPTVINPTAQERPVVFDPVAKEFAACSLEEAVQPIAIAPEGYYLVLKNPSPKNDHPPAGGVYPAPDLDVGRKINITGPCAFALWPGQMVRLVQGHHLRSNQYVLVRVYNEDEARKSSDLSLGKLYIIKGTDVSFYIPPTGVGVVPDEHGQWVREALTLERLEYCILVDENGKKRYERGPQVVFPEPTETFIGGKQRAIELSELEGLHVKVIAPYADYREGDELFITGKETSIYYPREEHVIVGTKHVAIAVPAGEGRYVLNRKTGEIRMVRGPAMLLPNPIAEALAERSDGVPSATAVSVGNAVLVVDKQGRRRVEQGPKNLLLEYDETLEVLHLSTGTPKTDNKLVATVFLRVLNNKVSDGCVVETLDHVAVTLRYSLRVSFEGEPARWFEVENYVRFLCDHVRSVLKGIVKKHAIEGFYAHSVEIIRDGLLGQGQEKTDEKGGRPGMRFAENGMHVTDVELLEVVIDDEDIAELLGAAQHEAVEANIALLRARRGLEMTEKQEGIARGEAAARAQTAHELAELELAAAADRLRVALASVQAELEQAEVQRQAAIARNAVADAEHAAELARQRAAAAAEHEARAAQQELTLVALRAEVDAAVQRFGAAQGGFSEALLALSNHEVLAKVAEAMSVQAFVGGKTLTDVIDKVFAGTPLAGVMDRVKARVGNGVALAPPT